jgi:hypothetical protein
MLGRIAVNGFSPILLALFGRSLQVELADESKRQLDALRHDRAELVVSFAMVQPIVHSLKNRKSR